MVGGECPVEVIDSRVTTMGLGQLAIAANTIAESRGNLQQVTEEVKQVIPIIHLLGLLDTLKYLALGRHIGKVQALLGSVLSVKPMLTIKDGELVPAGRIRSRAKGIDRLFDFVKNTVDIQDVAIVTTVRESKTFQKRADFAIGHPKNPMSLSEVVDKFKKCLPYAARPLDRGKIDKSIKLLTNLEQVSDISILPELLT